jgi:hypothetical protein
MAGYEQAKDKMSGLRRNNFVLWKHIKKLKRKYRKSRKNLGVEMSDDEPDLDLDENDPEFT